METYWTKSGMIGGSSSKPGGRDLLYVGRLQPGVARWRQNRLFFNFFFRFIVLFVSSVCLEDDSKTSWPTFMKLDRLIDPGKKNDCSHSGSIWTHPADRQQSWQLDSMQKIGIFTILQEQSSQFSWFLTGSLCCFSFVNDANMPQSIKCNLIHIWK